MPISVTPFVEALRDRTARLRSLHSEGRTIIGYFCTYTPIEIIHAAGFLPVRILGGVGQIDRAYTLAPAFICPPLLRSLETALEGGFDYLSGIVQGYTCDVACGIVNIWKENFGGRICHTIPLPYGDGPDAREYFRASLEELMDKLETIGGRTTEASLDASLALYAEIRRAILDLYEMRYQGKLPLAASELHAVIQAGFVAPPETYLVMLKTLAEQIAPTGDGVPRGIPVLVSGSLVEEPKVLDILEEAGGRIVADDLCTGLRHVHNPAGVGSDAVARIIDRYINRLPCPSRARARQRLPFLLDLVRRSGTRGIVFLFQKFCTPHLADYPILRDELRKEGIPLLTLELEATGVTEGQLKTRLQSFMEMIER